MSTVDNAFLAAQSLGTDEKLQLISRIWNSIPSSSFRPSDRDLAEMKRRWAEYEAGTMEARPWEEVRDSVRRRLGLHG
jgi:putative addiction module component (TIGR02574 family)